VAEHFGAMALPVGEFLALEHGTEFWGVDRAELQARRRAAGPPTPSLFSAAPRFLGQQGWLRVGRALVRNRPADGRRPARVTPMGARPCRTSRRPCSPATGSCAAASPPAARSAKCWCWRPRGTRLCRRAPRGHAASGPLGRPAQLPVCGRARGHCGRAAGCYRVRVCSVPRSRRRMDFEPEAPARRRARRTDQLPRRGRAAGPARGGRAACRARPRP